MADKFEVLNDREHTLLKGHLMLGSMVEEPYEMYINGERKTLNVVPAVLTIIREIIDNSLDEHIRSKRRYATSISIDMKPFSLTVKDNGRGIPVEYYKNEDGVNDLRPVLCWTRLRAGTSFSEHNFGPSANGVGSSVSNIFSSVFRGETCDGKKYCIVNCKENMSSVSSYVEEANGREKGTSVYLELDFERFGITHFTEDHIIAAKERILALSAAYPSITFTFNGERIRTRKPAEYLNRYNREYVPCSSDNWFFGVMPTDNDEYTQVTFCEGLHIRNGGSIETYISKEISYALRELIKKKHKMEMSPGEIKRGLMIVFDGSMFPNMKFDSQTKERMVNSEADVKAYMGEVDFEKIAKEIMKVPAIIDPIIETKLAKQIAAEKRANTIAQNKMKTLYVEKHIPAKDKNPANRVLALTEGDSAAGGIAKVRDINRLGVFPLRGKAKQVFGMKEKDILANKELANIMAITGLKFGMTEDDLKYKLNYGTIGIFTDNDLDGSHCFSLLILFLALWPDLFKLRKVVRIEPPMYIFTKNAGKKNETFFFCYSKEEYIKALNDPKNKGYTIRYIKGNGSLNDNELKQVLSDESKWKTVIIDDSNCFDIMFGDDVTKRREIMEI